MELRADWEFRGLVHQATDPLVLERLSAGGVTAYIGFDPTASSLHLGHLLQICNLRRLQLAGNRPIALAGGGTGLIGDPSFKDSERPLLTREQIDENLEGIRAQLARFLDFSPAAGSTQALLLNNADWLTTIPLTDFLRDVGKHFTVNQMIAKEAVKSRLEREDVGLSFTEFSYTLLQAYDFLRLHLDHDCTLQLGGSDQWGNITFGTELVRKAAGRSAAGLTSPLLLRPDGRKFGKSDGGNERVWLDAERTSPFALYQFLVNVDDVMVPTLLRFYTFLEHEEILELDQRTLESPQERAGQRALARAVVELVHGADALAGAERASEALFAPSIRDLDEALLLQVTADAPSSDISLEELRDGLDPVDLLVRCELAGSRGEARRFVEQGGCYVNNERVGSEDRVGLGDVLHGRYLLVRRGRRDLHLVVVR
ncbi:MAG: tyrosine--tRNA ligase [Acidimicrobiaceae bacterium]|nr:tyrosine--tRNA ligase [Acidimicrobiaceae bacterium]